MALRRTPFAFGENYHIYNRGNSKQTIFKDNGDYSRFQSLLYLANGSESFEFRDLEKEKIYEYERGEQLVSIGAYCQMPNHFHILLTPLAEDGVSLFMKKVTTGYSMYFNQKYERTGSLFEGRFKSEHANTDEYLKYLFSYIHLNPVKLIQSDWKEEGIRNAGEAAEYLIKYQYSSFLEFYGGRTSVEQPEARKEEAILDKKAFPEYFPTPESFYREILEWINYSQKIK